MPTVSSPPPKLPTGDPGGLDRSNLEPIVTEVAHDEHRALGWAALIAVLLIGWLVMPIGAGILLGTLLAFMVQPFFERLRPHIGPRWSALATVVASSLSFAGLLGGLAWLFVEKGSKLAQALIDALSPGGSGGGVLATVGRLTSRLGVPPEEVAARARAYAEGAVVRAESIAELLVSTVASSLLGLFFMMLAMHFMLRNWDEVTRRAEETFPLRPDYTAALFAEFRRVGRTTLLGTIVTGIAQGVLATIGYWATGVPEPIFFGAATALASLIPAVGTMLVWIPAGIALIALDHPTRGIIELAWGLVVVVGVSDYVIRPLLVSGESEVPSLVTFAALFGGVEVFGLKGLILGPVLMSLGISVLRLYADETRKRRARTA